MQIDERVTDNCHPLVEMIEYEYKDRYATAEASARVLSDMKKADEINRAFRRGGSAVTEENNPGLDYILSVAPGIAPWRMSAKLSPSLALDPFYMPVPGLVSSLFEEDAAATAWLANQPIGPALRARAEIEQKIYHSRKNASDWLIVAAGRGRHPLLAATKVHELGQAPHVDFVDIDRRALHNIQGLAYDCDYKNLSLIDRDILDLKGFERQRTVPAILRRMASGRWPLYTPKRIKPEHYGIVSGIGISMYLEDSAWMLQLGKKVLGRSEVKKAGVIELLRSMWRHVKPGGILVMDAISPATEQNYVELQLNTIQTIGWRPMHPRSTDKMLDLAKQAGITAKHITRYVEPEDFFSVYVFEKESLL